MNEIKVSFTRTERVSAPKYATEGSAACDLCADIPEPITLEPGDIRLFPTGLAISPERSDVVSIIAGRSGLGVKFGITLVNGIGVIDSDYRGEIKVALINRGKAPYTVQPLERIAQLFFLPVYAASFVEVDALDDTERGSGGFGSTGK